MAGIDHVCMYDRKCCGKVVNIQKNTFSRYFNHKSATVTLNNQFKSMEAYVKYLKRIQ